MALPCVLDIAIAIEALPLQAILSSRHVLQYLIAVEELIEVLCHGTRSSAEGRSFPTRASICEIRILEQCGNIYFRATIDKGDGFGISFGVGLRLQGRTIGALFCGFGIEGTNVFWSQCTVVEAQVVEESIGHASITSKWTAT